MAAGENYIYEAAGTRFSKVEGTFAADSVKKKIEINIPLDKLNIAIESQECYEREKLSMVKADDWNLDWVWKSNKPGTFTSPAYKEKQQIIQIGIGLIEPTFTIDGMDAEKIDKLKKDNTIELVCTNYNTLYGEENEETQKVQSVLPAYQEFKSWADEFESASLEQKKMIAGHLFKRVEVSKVIGNRDCKVSVEMNMTYRQFCKEWSTNENIAV